MSSCFHFVWFLLFFFVFCWLSFLGWFVILPSKQRKIRNNGNGAGVVVVEQTTWTKHVPPSLVSLPPSPFPHDFIADFICCILLYISMANDEGELLTSHDYYRKTPLEASLLMMICFYLFLSPIRLRLPTKANDARACTVNILILFPGSPVSFFFSFFSYFVFGF